jgi:signal transduction protein with GAF and PtsI domain
VTTQPPALGPSSPRAFTALREIARALSSALDLDTTLDLIVRQTTEIMGVDSCAIYLLDTDDVTLRLRASTGLARRALGLATLQVGEGMTGYAVVQNRPVYAADAQHDPHFKWLEDTEERRFRSLLAVPLLLNDRPSARSTCRRPPHATTRPRRSTFWPSSAIWLPGRW